MSVYVMKVRASGTEVTEEEEPGERRGLGAFGECAPWVM